ncbi:NTP transferase domain-containing protein [Dactylosporangium sp. NBC_01737]|nr:NTP transferase domain-containing protein [Dactylosporangium sp. NBC_01737]
MLAVGGVPMLDRVLAALAGAGLRIVVGPARSGVAAGVWTVREDPPGAGPAAATAAALGVMTTSGEGGGSAAVGAGLVGVFAADLPYLTGEAVGVLVGAVGAARVDGAVYVDERGKRQLLCGVWREAALREGVGRLGDPVGKSMRAVFDGLVVAEVRWEGDGPAPYFDCDTDEDLRRAEQQPAEQQRAERQRAEQQRAEQQRGQQQRGQQQRGQQQQG